MGKRIISFTRLLAVLVVLLLAVLDLPAATIFDSGTVTFVSTGNQFGRLNRNGVSSDWASVKSFPGVFGAPAARAYELFTVNSGPFPYIQISLDDPGAALFVSAYITAYTPVNAAPNFGLNVNYLGDAGSSQPFGNPSFFQIFVTPFTNIYIPVNEVNAGGGSGRTFNLLVEGFYDADYNDVAVPEPSSLILLSCGTIVLAGFLRKKGSIRRH